MTILVGGGSKYLFFFKLFFDLARSSSLHTKVENLFDHLCGFFVNDPFFRVVGILYIPIWHIDGQSLATLALCFLHGSDFAAGIFGEKFVKPVLDTCNIAVGAVGIDAVKVVVDGNVPHIVLRESVVDVQSRQRRITTESGKVFRNDRSHTTGFDFAEHFLKAWAVEANPTPAVVDEKCRGWETIIPCVLKQHGFLILDGIRQIFLAVFLLILGVLYGQSAIECCDFLGCP